MTLDTTANPTRFLLPGTDLLLLTFASPLHTEDTQNPWESTNTVVRGQQMNQLEIEVAPFTQCQVACRPDLIHHLTTTKVAFPIKAVFKDLANGVEPSRTIGLLLRMIHGVNSIGTMLKVVTCDRVRIQEK